MANLRDQPVEIHHGDAVVVVAPFDQTELADVPAGGAHLAELARQGLVSVQSPEPAQSLEPAEAGAGSTRRRAGPARPRSTGPRKRPGEGTEPAKPPEGGS